jgi:hypothetical protein
MSENNSIDIAERQENDLDYSVIPDVIEPQIIKAKRTRKPMSEENKQKMRESMARARIIKIENAKNKAEINNKFKEKVNTIENLDAVIERKILEKIPVKKEKPPKEPKIKVDKEVKLKQKKEMIEYIVNEKLKAYKPIKQPESDFKLIQRFF